MPRLGYAPKTKSETISQKSKPVPLSKYTKPLPNRNKLAKAPQARQFVKGGPKAPVLGK